MDITVAMRLAEHAPAADAGVRRRLRLEAQAIKLGALREKERAINKFRRVRLMVMETKIDAIPHVIGSAAWALCVRALFREHTLAERKENAQLAAIAAKRKRITGKRS